MKTIIDFILKRRKTLIPTVLGILTTIGFIIAFSIKPPVIEQLGNLLFDRYQNWAPREYHKDIPVRVIDVDDESLKRLGQWPWPRTTMATLNDRLAQAGAGVIAYDIIFSEEDRTSPEKIAAAIRARSGVDIDLGALDGLQNHDNSFAKSLSASNSVLGFFLVNYDTGRTVKPPRGFSMVGELSMDKVVGFYGALAALPILTDNATGQGFVSFNPKGDGIVRGAPMVYRVEDQLLPSLSLEAIRAVQGAGSYILSNSEAANSGASDSKADSRFARIKVGAFEMATDPLGNFRVYYTAISGDTNAHRIIPAWKILDPNTPVSEWADRVAGNVVFIGAGAEGLKDIVSTPMAARELGVVVHAQIAEQIIGEHIHGGGQLLNRPFTMDYLELYLILLPGLALILILPRLSAAWGALLSLSLIGGIAAYSWHKFSGEQILMNPIYPMLSIGTTYLIMTIASFYLTETERSRIRNAFSMYLSPTMVKKVSDDPGLLTLGGEERNITILFLDIRSFSKISEALTPQEITTFLNIFLTPMTDTLQDMKATIDKYIGDAIVAFWNAPLDDPEHEKNAARAILQMNETLEKLNADYNNQDDVKWPGQVSMGIGINTGICCVGNLGSEQRFSYSMIGDAANLASRIEGLTKQYRVSSLIGNSTAEAVRDFALLEADLIKVVGRQTPERIWILAGDETTAQTSKFQALRKTHGDFLTQFRAGDWDGALALLPQLKEAASHWDFAGYYDVIAERITEYKLTPPPADWGGVHIATSK